MHIYGQMCANILLESTSFSMIVVLYIAQFYSPVENRNSLLGFYMASAIIGHTGKHNRKYVESHKTSCAERTLSY